MIDPATSWFDKVELPTVRVTIPKGGKGNKATCLDYTTKDAVIFDKTSAQISNLVYKCWFSRYPCCCYMIYGKGSEFKLHFCNLCKTYGIKRTPTSIKNPQANAIVECIHAVFTNMLRTAELDMAKLFIVSDIKIFFARGFNSKAPTKKVFFLVGNLNFPSCPNTKKFEQREADVSTH